MVRGLESDYSDQRSSKTFMITFTPSDTINFGQTQYVGFGARGWNATEILRQVPTPLKGKMRKLEVNVIANSLVDTAVFNARKNGVDETPTLTIGAGATGRFSLIANTEFKTGDLVNWKIITNGGSGSIQFSVTHVVEHDIEELF